MKFIIDSPMTYRSVNAKGKEMNKWISTYKYVLLPDELSYDAFIEEVRAKALMLDKAYPRTKPLHVSITSYEVGTTRIEVYPEKNPDKLVFIVHIYLVRGEYVFAESSQIKLEGGLR